MPKVPVLDNFSVGAQTFNGPQLRAVAPEQAALAKNESLAQTQEQGRAMMGAGNALGNIAIDMANEANKLRVDDAMNQLVKLRLNTQAEALQLQGRNALERPENKPLPDEFEEKLRKNSQSIEESLSNPVQKRMYFSQAGGIYNQMRATLTSHMLQQQDTYAVQVAEGTINTAVEQGTLLWGDPTMRQQSTKAIDDALKTLQTKKGWDDNTLSKERQKIMGVMHGGIIQSMITAGNTGGAIDHYQQHAAEMNQQARDSFKGVLKEAGDVQLGSMAVNDAWDNLGPKSPNEPVKIYDIERRVSEILKNNPTALTKATAMVRERATAFNAQQAEVNAGNTNAVFGQIDKGTPMASVQTSKEWLSLPEKQRHDILKAIDAEAYTKEARLAAIAQRNASDAARNDAAEVRQERRLLSGNAAEYLTATDPDVLRNMSRAKVESLRAMFGFDATQQLLTKWDSLQKPGAVAEAKMDQDDFNHQAEQLGLRPHDTRKTEEEKASLGELKYRMEQLIHMQQTQLKRTLTRDEKLNLMQQEMSRTVLVDPGFFSAEKAVPVIRLSAKQIQDVQVPQPERVKIVAALKELYAKNPNDPRFAPTEENVKRAWVLKASPNSARLIGNGK